MIQSPKKEFLDTALKAAKSAAHLIQHSTKNYVTNYKSETDLVTNTDIDSEKIISDIIRSKFPGHGILAEESGLDNNKTTNYVWVIDPLDGTTNFVHNYPSYGVSIALLEKGSPIVGVIVELPAMNVYHATVDTDSYCNGEKIHVSSNKELIHSLLVTGFGYEHGSNWKKNMRLFQEFTDITQGVRRLGAAAVDLCHVACGKVDGFWEFDLNPWDVSAGILIVERAGGKIRKMNGGKYSIYDNQIMAANGHIDEEMIKVFKDII